ncbi:NosD domain-containing protein [Xanthomonas massiliensis]|uniref:NosD domain-containing protein n=1 Tax=Xanthomonas massiliensis TaxID=1720302 RepID=UPI000ADA7A81|nr:right-handed parallel beta-helix repeat-containing protein [Xanthomonas massiliensis]
MSSKIRLSLLAAAILAAPAFAQDAGGDPAIAGMAPPRPAPGQVLKVTSYADDGSAGTFRWALEQNNRNPGDYRIELSALQPGENVIHIESELPPIKGPVVIDNVSYGQTGTYVVIDGARYIGGTDPQSCPGAVPGTYGTNVRTTTKPGLILRDTDGVELHGLEVRNFCIGILINRARGSLIHDNRIVHNIGGAGIMLTGDDGKGNSTAATTVHNKILRNVFVDNGDAMEATRGSAFNLIADNFITSSDKNNKEPSQGLEILWGNDNAIVHNHFENMSDGVQLNWGNRNFISGNTFNGLSSAVTLSGTGNIVSGNVMHDNRVAVSVRPQAAPGPNGTYGKNRVLGPAVNTITANAMYDNGKDVKRCFAGGACLPDQHGAIVFNVPGLEHGQYVGDRGGGIESDPAKLEKICALDGNVADCEPTPNYGQAAPVLTSARRVGKGARLEGTFSGQPSTLYRVEVFANSRPGEDEAERYLGYVNVPVDAQGQARFVYEVPAGEAGGIANLTATLTTVDGATSVLSKPVALK